MRLSHRRALAGAVLATTAATLAVGFMLPVRPRLREPNDVHHAFREQSNAAAPIALQQQQPQPLAGPGLLLQSAHPALPALGAATAAAEEGGPEDGMTAFEELFSIDKAHGLGDFSILDSPINADPLVVMEGAGAAAFVPLQEIKHEGKVIRQRGVAGGQGGNGDKGALLKEVAAHLGGQARQAFEALRAQILAYVDGLMQAIQKLFSAGDESGASSSGSRRRRRATVGDRVARRYQTARASAVAAVDGAQAAFAGQVAGLRADVELLVAACRARLGVWREMLAGQVARWQGALEQDERFCAVRGRCAAVASKAQKVAGRALGKGRQLAVRAKAWGLSVRARLPFDSDAAGAGVARPVRLGGGVVAELLEGAADETQVPPFSLAYVSGGASSGARAAYSSLLDSPFDDLEPYTMEEAAAPVAAVLTEAAAEAAAEPMAEEQGAKADMLVNSNSVLRDALLTKQAQKMEEAVETSVAEEEEDDEDDGPSGGSPAASEAAADTAVVAPASAPAGIAMFAGAEVSASERAAAAELKARLGTLEAGATRWVEEADLLRYAREFGNVEEAWAALSRTCAWRAERGVEALMATTDFSQSPLSEELFWMGSYDKEGDPVLLFRTALHHPGALPTAEYEKFMTWILETGRQRYGLGKGKRLTLLVDRKDAGIRQQDPFLVMDIVPLLQAHWPGCLKVTYIAPVNAIFQFIWKIFTFILAPSTTSRVKLLGPGPDAYKPALLAQFRPEQLPTHLGGTLRSYDERQRDGNGTAKASGSGNGKPALSAA